MIQLFLNAIKSVREEAETGEAENWRCDPLAHPVLAGMSERELADLPFEPWRIRPCAARPEDR